MASERLNQREYCEPRGFSLEALGNWRAKFKAEDGAERSSSEAALRRALAVQMACTHTAAMAVLAKLDVGFATERRVAAFGSAAARLMRAYATEVEVLRRLRNGGQQFVRVEHVHVNDGGQAVIGNVKKQDTRVEERRTT